ncbi:MAG: sigma-E factor negative regulatory protein [Gammaproteobacteria bacterium]|nr:sigma-E factor negative regulatory protein [Gammaproteobacteria bacterium]
MSQASTSNGVQETLSAAMDGEATVDELHGALDAASGDDALRAKWERMHFASAVMRGALTTSATPSASIPLAARLGRRVAKPSRRPRLRLGPSVAAVVAALAALTVVLVAGLMQEGEAPNLVADRQAPPPAAAPNARAATDLQPSVPEVELAPIDRRRMNAYMLQHARYNAAAGTAGIPLARVLGDAPTAESADE